MEETLFETEEPRSRAEIARVLGAAAAELAGDGPVTLKSDGQSVTVQPPERPTFEVEVEREVEDDTTETSIEFEIEWEEADDGTQPEADAEDVVDVTPRPPDSLARFEVFRDRADEHRWRLVHRNGNIIATSGEGYTTKANALKGARSVMRNAPGAEFVSK
ncbi:amphi-Trp domain-containing protein [Halococcus salsus]|uniref:amphi-Trp domain-containing protein n=1 Tax=Halococcus salsus TaxID=2162894 RepID=UPI0013573D6F|nr:amphi-Trp domain-containing protein [Halococcus salsus]